MVVHWDVWGSTAELLDAGARLLASRTPDTPWDVLADPEGNEFCVFTRDRGRAHRHRSGLARAR
ncbi:MAG TPA: VOC family protein [Microlunatus sp.]